VLKLLTTEIKLSRQTVKMAASPHHEYGALEHWEIMLFHGDVRPLQCS